MFIIINDEIINTDNVTQISRKQHGTCDIWFLVFEFVGGKEKSIEFNSLEAINRAFESIMYQIYPIKKI